MYLEKGYRLIADDDISVTKLQMDTILALSYMRIEQLDEAGVLFNNCHIHAKSIKYDRYIGITLHNLGCWSVKMGEYTQALEYFEQAFEFPPENDRVYCENLYFKMYCLIKQNRFKEAKTLLDNSKDDVNDNKRYKPLFKALSHLTDLKSASSRDFLLKSAIPKMIESREYYKAQDFCQILEDYCTAKVSKIKALEFASISRDIYEKIMKGDEP